MKCPHCGATSQEGICEFCDSVLYQEIPTITISNSTKSATKETPLWLWILGWLCIFPLPMTILFLRKKNMKPSIKYGLIVSAWILYVMIGLSGESETINIPVTESATTFSLGCAFECALI